MKKGVAQIGRKKAEVKCVATQEVDPLQRIQKIHMIKTPGNVVKIGKIKVNSGELKWEN